QAATYAATQPFAAAIRTAVQGETRPTSAVTRPSPSSTATTGSTSAFATTPSSGTWPNRSQRIGAVATLQVAETASATASLRGTGYPSSTSRTGPSATKMATTAANDSSNPGSNNS